MALAYEELVPTAYRAAFVTKVGQIAVRLGMPADWLMIVMRVETAGTFSPSIRNYAGSGAVGLIQFTKTGVAGLGVTVDQLATMDAVTQLDYVEKYVRQYAAKIRNVYDLYISIFAPAYLGKPDSQVAYTAYSSTPEGKRQYELNKVLDKDLDGNVTLGEIKEAISRYVPAGVSTGTVNGHFIALALVLIIGFFMLKRNI
ncbi:transglycosylase SLT domain-containing protein [Spirosoma litoris]